MSAEVGLDGGPARPPVAILCGGRGTRLQEHTQEIPKPLVEIGGMPIVWHVIQLYAARGFRRFLLATGYRGELIERFASGQRWPEGVTVECLDTGLETQTGGRIKALAPALAGEGRFCATYADGLSDVDLGALLAFHDGHGALATMTVVRPRLGFGVTQLDRDGTVTGFREKPRSEHWINGGFFCFQAEVLERLETDRGARARPPRAPRRSRRAAGLPPRGLLGVHGHLQGRRRPQRPVGLGRGAVALLGGSPGGRRADSAAGRPGAPVR